MTGPVPVPEHMRKVMVDEMPRNETSSVDAGTVLVTGAARRIGRALAENLAAAGWRIAIHCNKSVADADAVAAKIKADGGECAVIAADLADPAAVSDLVARAAEKLGPVSCLINNASLFEHDQVETVTPETWDAHMGVNLRAPFFLSQAFARDLPTGAAGAIINIIDQRVWNLGADFTSYTLSKYGLWGMTQILARSLAPHVRVNAIGPGPTLASHRQSHQDFERQWKSTPLGRPVEAAEICRAVRFILDAPAMTGQMIALDSGQHLGQGFVDDAGQE